MSLESRLNAAFQAIGADIKALMQSSGGGNARNIEVSATGTVYPQLSVSGQVITLTKDRVNDLVIVSVNGQKRTDFTFTAPNQITTNADYSAFEIMVEYESDT